MLGCRCGLFERLIVGLARRIPWLRPGSAALIGSESLGAAHPARFSDST
jgi:hypothetical protein